MCFVYYKDKEIADPHLPPSPLPFVSQPVLTLVYIGPYKGEINELLLELRLGPLRFLRSTGIPELHGFILGSPIASDILSARFLSNCDILGVKVIRIDPLEPNIWLSYVPYAVLAAVF